MTALTKPVLTEEQAFEKYKSERLSDFLADEANPKMSAQLSAVMIPTSPGKSTAEALNRLGLFGARTGVNSPNVSTAKILDTNKRGPTKGSSGA